MGLLVWYFPFISAYSEYKYHEFTRPDVEGEDSSGKEIKLKVEPKSEDFGIIIEKLGINEVVVEDVNIHDSQALGKALGEGVAHIRGTAYPGEEGNVFLTAHSTQEIWLTRVNAPFSLLRELEKGDMIVLVYEGEIFGYKVTGKEVVESSDVGDLNGISEGGEKTLTLQTCEPPGTSFRRLLVYAKEVDSGPRA